MPTVLYQIYTLFIRFYSGLIALTAPFNAKARAWRQGRAQWRTRLRVQAQHLKPGRILWVHAASLGEFEQGRPLIEALKTEGSDWQVVLSFFSPSGYEIRKNYPFADLVCYLPADTPANARDFVEIIGPAAAVFVKYEFWGNYLATLKQKRIPTLLVSGLFRPDQPFFAWYGAFWRSMLGCFDHFFVQNRESADLLQSIGFQNFSIAGDTRIDRVLHIAEQAVANDLVAAFTASARHRNQTVLIAGSSWEADENVYLPVLQKPEFQHIALIVAPHDPKRIGKNLDALPGVLRYSRATPETAAQCRTLIIDNVGMLNTLYRYGALAYIGGGFGKSIHNILEPAAFGLPVIFGPAFGKFEEARQLIARGGAWGIRSGEDLAAVLARLAQEENYSRASEAAKGWLRENSGATAKILSFLLQIDDKKP